MSTDIVSTDGSRLDRSWRSRRRENPRTGLSPPSTLAPGDELLRVENLHVGFEGRDHVIREVVRGVSFTVAAGHCLAIVGESGSGKSVTARTLVGLTGGRSHVHADRLELAGRDLRGLPDRRWRRIRGREVGFILQDALVSLDQLRPVGKEIAEALALHGWGSRDQRRRRAIELLGEVGVPEPEVRVRQLPGELSGGMRQRALIASALALDPPLLIADEPTTALDVTIQAQVLALLEQTKRRGRALILISHDLAVVAHLADTVAVMNNGEVVEFGTAAEVLRNPRHEYTRTLLDAVPSAASRGTRLSHLPRRRSIGDGEPRATSPEGAPVIEAKGLIKRYRGPDGVDRTVVDDVSFTLAARETLGIVGESGSGKTTTARLALGLVNPDAGEVLLGGKPWSALRERDRRARRRHISVVYQDPLSSFDPRWTVNQIVTDALPPQERATAADGRRRVVELLDLVGLEDEHRTARPLQLSGGQRQRVAIARALAPRPYVVVCDEPVSALDVSIQAQVLDLLTDLQKELGVSYLFISHDLGVIHHMSDRIVVMNDGKIIEQGTADDVLFHPNEPYTQRLVASLPTLDSGLAHNER
jgi:peptide/nickel transport system ATP-binding protein